MKKNANDRCCFRRRKTLSGIQGTFLILFLFLAGILSCTTVDKTARKIARDLNPASGSMRIRMAILPLVNKTSLKPEFLEKEFQKPLTLALRRKCAALLLETGAALSDTGKMDAASQKEIDPFLLMETGRARGFNAVSEIRMESIGARVEQRGILWFKGDRHLLQVHADAEIWDTLTGTKILSQDFYFEVPVDDALYDRIRLGKDLEAPQIQNALVQIAGEIADAACEAVDGLPWRGYIVSVKGDAMSLSSGKREGLKIGAVLTVYDSGRIIRGIDGRRFLLPGKPVGEIQITALESDTSEARALSGGPFGESNSVGFD